MGKFIFNHKWLSDAKFSWMREFKCDKHKAMCFVCNKLIIIKCMGESAIKSHMKGNKHKKSPSKSANSKMLLQIHVVESSTIVHGLTIQNCYSGLSTTFQVAGKNF